MNGPNCCWQSAVAFFSVINVALPVTSKKYHRVTTSWNIPEFTKIVLTLSEILSGAWGTRGTHFSWRLKKIQVAKEVLHVRRNNKCGQWENIILQLRCFSLHSFYQYPFLKNLLSGFCKPHPTPPSPPGNY